MNYDVVIVGGGLAGIFSGLKLKELGFNPLIIDFSLPEAKGSLGGFMKFSGAKFSLPPAGLGLLDVASSEEELYSAIEDIENILELGLNSQFASVDLGEKLSYIRKYDSIVLSKEEIDKLSELLTEKIKNNGIDILNGNCLEIDELSDGLEVLVETESNLKKIKSKAVFCASGRTSKNLLKNLGVKTTVGKGLDVGVRVEFLTSNDLLSLRNYGPDAKVIKGNCRTFCLNVPGEIYYYQFNRMAIPGGVVASKHVDRSNVGLLCRVNDKKDVLDKIIKRYDDLTVPSLGSGVKVEGEFLGESRGLIEQLLGKEIVDDLLDFSAFLEEQGFVDWSKPHIIHFPLLDWHWDTFAKEKTFKTSVKGVYCLGDISGHARGLLQAAISGVLAAKEYGDENS